MDTRVTQVAVIRPFTLEVTFRDGKQRIVDMTDEIRERGGVFIPLKDPAYFALALVDPVTRTVVWPNGLDLAPEWLYEPDPEKYWAMVAEESAKSTSRRPRSKASKALP